MNVVIAPMIMLMMWNQSFGVCQIDPIDPQAYLRNYLDIFLRGLLKDTTAPLPASDCSC